MYGSTIDRLCFIALTVLRLPANFFALHHVIQHFSLKKNPFAYFMLSDIAFTIVTSIGGACVKLGAFFGYISHSLVPCYIMFLSEYLPFFYSTLFTIIISITRYIIIKEGTLRNKSFSPTKIMRFLYQRLKFCYNNYHDVCDLLSLPPHPFFKCFRAVYT